MKKAPSKLKLVLVNLAVALLVVIGAGIYTLYWLDDYTEHGAFIVVPDFSTYTPAEAETVATHADLQVQVVDSLYDDNAAPGTVVEQYPLPGSHVKRGRMLRLTVNASNPEKIMLPRLQNAAYRQTIQTLETRGFRIGRLEYAPSEFQNLVLALKHKGEEVQPGTLLPKGATIDLLLGTGTGSHPVSIPPLIGKTLREAMLILRNTYLNTGTIVPDSTISAQTDLPAAFVYKQLPETTLPVERGTDIELHVTLSEEKLIPRDSLTTVTE